MILLLLLGVARAQVALDTDRVAVADRGAVLVYDLEGAPIAALVMGEPPSCLAFAAGLLVGVGARATYGWTDRLDAVAPFTHRAEGSVRCRSDGDIVLWWDEASALRIEPHTGVWMDEGEVAVAPLVDVFGETRVDGDGPVMASGARPVDIERPDRCGLVDGGAAAICPGPLAEPCASTWYRLSDGAALAEIPGCTVLASGAAGAVTTNPGQSGIWLIGREGALIAELPLRSAVAAVSDSGFALYDGRSLRVYGVDGALVVEIPRAEGAVLGEQVDATGPAVLLGGPGWTEVVEPASGEVRYRVAVPAPTTVAVREGEVIYPRRIAFSSTGWRPHQGAVPLPRHAWTVDSNRSGEAHTVLHEGEPTWTLSRSGKAIIAQDGALVLVTDERTEAWSSGRRQWSAPWTGKARVEHGLVTIQADDTSRVLDLATGRLLWEGEGSAVPQPGRRVLVGTTGGRRRTAIVDLDSGGVLVDVEGSLELLAERGDGVLVGWSGSSPSGTWVGLVRPDGWVWKRPLGGRADVEYAAGVVIVAAGQAVITLQPDTGEVLWTRLVDLDLKRIEELAP